MKKTDSPSPSLSTVGGDRPSNVNTSGNRQALGKDTMCLAEKSGFAKPGAGIEPDK